LPHFETGLGQAGVSAQLDHALGTGAGLLDVAGQVERLGDERIAGYPIDGAPLPDPLEPV
jgi:hypothetical protein